MEVYEEIGLLDLMINVLEINPDLAYKYYCNFRKIWFNHGITEPLFTTVDKIDHPDVIGVFYEDYRRNRIYLTNNIFDFEEKGKLFYLTHEIVHYTDFYGLGDCRSENETDTEAIKILTSWGMWNNGNKG